MTKHDEGVSIHSKPKNYIVFSVYKEDASPVKNITNHEYASRVLWNVTNGNHKEIEGCYKHVKEKSFIVNFKYAHTAILLAHAFNQESVLLLRNHKHGLYKAALWFLDDGREEAQGFIRAVPKGVALKHDCYSYDPAQDKYFITTPSDATKYCDLEVLYAQ